MNKRIILFGIPFVLFLIITIGWVILAALLSVLLQIPVHVALWITFGVVAIVAFLTYLGVKTYASKNKLVNVSDLDFSMQLIVVVGTGDIIANFAKGDINDGIVALIFVIIYGLGISRLKKRIEGKMINK